MSPKSVSPADYRCVVNINNQPITMPYPIIISIVEDGQKVRYYGEYRAGSISMDSSFSHHISSSNSDSCELVIRDDSYSYREEESLCEGMPGSYRFMVDRELFQSSYFTIEIKSGCLNVHELVDYEKRGPEINHWFTLRISRPDKVERIQSIENEW
ncbi:hypothetical protein F8C67_08140 [Phaeocystidibacter luteus]|uniref:Uncharacterized protein n=2 Tax=Phaeocystidibacter luteus TaxID=911197 RepID=A0A6N6RG86_9FLAO|nr:hypothetical protein F8C67_08140 [Phaeocystidibacter luteus]